MKFSERNKDRQPALDRSPFDEPSDNPEPSKPARPGDTDPARPAGAPAPALAARTNPAAQPRGAGVPAAQQPLPSKEETMRQIEEEAANNQAKVQQMEEREAADLRSFRYQERVKFRDELRAVLQEHGNQAGPEINQLAKRYSFDKDPERLIQATRVWRQARASQAAKVKTIRALELPEALILDFLSDDFHAKVRTPGGPRNENEVRVRAANRLLQLELPPEDAMPLSRPPADPLPARTPRSRASAFPGGQVQRGR